jgi:uncharacterized protein YbcI
MQEKLMNISSLLSKLLRKNFGRGPDSCHAFAKDHFLVFYIRGFLSTLENVLIEYENIDNIKISRNIIMDKILLELKEILELDFQTVVAFSYHDWNYLKNTGIITVVFDQEAPPFESEAVKFKEYKDTIDEVERLSILIQKKPDKIEVVEITSRLFLVIREGILVPIEKTLIQKGQEKTLLLAKDELEKIYFHQEGNFDLIFNRSIVDIFVHWNIKEDRSLTYLFLS